MLKGFKIDIKYVRFTHSDEEGTVINGWKKVSAYFETNYHAYLQLPFYC